ncbi:hypothetical protein RB653_007432 [Dictyostelium firmibasis]|uniref:peptidylprolyl isomerase n=1 Tax=Dictyostelium firmibasis TaxID=79012 RepID=A0AAN7YRB0_9MYCE
MIPQSFQDEYNFINKYIGNRENSFKAIFIPNNNQIEPFEIHLSKDKFYEEAESILNCENIRKELISKNDVSYFYYPELKEFKAINERALKTKKKKPLAGDAILIRGNRERGELDITYELFLRFEEFFSPKQRVFDFESNFNGNQTDILSVLSQPSSFNYSIEKVKNGRFLEFPNKATTTDWKSEPKQPNAILNEYKAVIPDAIISIESYSIGPNNSSPHFSTAKINDIPLTIYSNFTKKKDESIHNVSLRTLYYLVILQQRLLNFSDNNNTQENDNDIFSFYNDHLIEKKEYEESLPPSPPSSSLINSDDTSPTLSTTSTTSITSTTTTKPKSKINTIEKTEFLISNINNEDILKFYGINMNKNNKVVYVKEGISNVIIYENPEKRRVEHGDEVTIAFSYHSFDNNVVKVPTEQTVTVGKLDNCIDGLHHALKEMRENDIVLSVVHSMFAFGEKGVISGDIDLCGMLVKPSSTIGILIELVEIKRRSKFTDTKIKSMTTTEKINLIKANNQNAKENLSTKDKLFNALKIYKNNRALCNLDLLGQMDADQWDEMNLLASQTFTNLAICYSRMIPPQHIRVIEYCKESMVFEETSKAFRLASNAYRELNEIGDAIKYMEIAKEIDFNIENESKKNGTSVKVMKQLEYTSLINKLKILERKEEQKEKVIFEKLFKCIESSGFDVAKDDDFN